MAVNVLRQVSF